LRESQHRKNNKFAQVKEVKDKEYTADSQCVKNLPSASGCRASERRPRDFQTFLLVGRDRKYLVVNKNPHRYELR